MHEERRGFAGHQQINQSVVEVNRFLNFNRLVRTMATVFRTLDVMKMRHRQGSDQFKVEELSSANNFFIKEHQSLIFVKEASTLCNKGEIGNKSALRNLSAYLDTIIGLLCMAEGSRSLCTALTNVLQF